MIKQFITGIVGVSMLATAAQGATFSVTQRVAGGSYTMKKVETTTKQGDESKTETVDSSRNDLGLTNPASLEGLELGIRNIAEDVHVYLNPADQKVGVGYSVTPEVEVVGRVQFARNSVKDGDTEMTMGAGAGVNYYMDSFEFAAELSYTRNSTKSSEEGAKEVVASVFGGEARAAYVAALSDNLSYVGGVSVGMNLDTKNEGDLKTTNTDVKVQLAGLRYTF